MEVKFALKMKQAEIKDICVEYFEIGWKENLSAPELADRLNLWLNDEGFLQQRLPDLKDAAFCELTIDPS